MLKGKKEIIFVCLISVVLSFIIYGNGIKGGFVFDDSVVIEKRSGDLLRNPILSFFAAPYHQRSPHSGLFRPLPVVSYALEYRMLGSKPWHFHVVNILLHSFNAVLAYLLLFKLSKNEKLASLAALLFLFHPIHTEAVTSIVGRAELLAFFWAVLAAIVSLRGFGLLEAGAFFLALLSKESALAVLPILIFIKRWRLNLPWSAVWRKSVYLAPALAVYFLLRYLALGEYMFKSGVVNFIENPLKFLPLAERLGTAFKVLSLYVLKLLWPVHLSADYSYSSFGFVNMTSVSALLGLAILAVSVAVLWKKRRGWLAVGIAFFFFPYLLISNLALTTGTVMAERLMYLPSLGFLAVLSYAALGLAGRRKTLLWAAAGVMLVWYGYLVFDRNKDWFSDEKIFTAAERLHPDSMIPRVALAAIDMQNEKWAEAKHELDRAVSIYSGYSPLQNLLGVWAGHSGDQKAAEGYFIKSAELNPKSINPRVNLANLYIKQKQYQKALEHLVVLVELNPARDFAVKYGYLLIAVGKSNEAISVANKYLSTNDAEYFSILGTAYFNNKDYIRALEYLLKAKQYGKSDPAIDEMINMAGNKIP